jgi:hypothetical protein
VAERVSVELALAWRWRCEADNQLFSGSTLRIINRNSGALVPLAELRDAKVDRSDLRHGCGSGNLIPVAPDLDYRPGRGKS